MDRKRCARLAAFGIALLMPLLAAAGAGQEEKCLREPIYDTAVHADEALVNVSVAMNRWPDCTTLETAVGDIFRLEGVADASDQAKALALWKWFRILMSPTGGHYAYEGPRGHERLCHDPHRIFAVYGHHQCFDYRFHIVHALGRLGGPEARRALEDLARNDPFRAVREEAARALKEMR